MSSPHEPPHLPDWYLAAGLTERDAALMVLDDLDYDSQLAAIRHLLRVHRAADDELETTIKEIDECARRTSGGRNEQAVDDWIEHVHGAVYQDAAHSMAAVGMLAPFIESLFDRAFAGIRNRVPNGSPILQSHLRWQRPRDEAWDCHFIWSREERRTDVVDGILELSDALGLAQYMPADLRITLQALFGYRNKMVHCGFEWPVAERDKFERRIQECKWRQDWFSMATHNERPWIFYMSGTFIEHCLEAIEAIIVGIGRYCCRELR